MSRRWLRVRVATARAAGSGRKRGGAAQRLRLAQCCSLHRCRSRSRCATQRAMIVAAVAAAAADRRSGRLVVGLGLWRGAIKGKEKGKEQKRKKKRRKSCGPPTAALRNRKSVEIARAKRNKKKRQGKRLSCLQMHANARSRSGGTGRACFRADAADSPAARFFRHFSLFSPRARGRMARRHRPMCCGH